MQAMIDVQAVSKQYGDLTAVDSISFSVQQGETLALVGTSGCGKTTTLKMINRLVEPSSGSIFVNGKNILDQSPELIRREMGYVIQHIGLFPHYTIAQNVGIVPGLLGWEASKISERTHFLLDRLELDPTIYAHKYPHQLSGGQQQRVGIARALAADPPIILMDEPFGALDPITRADIRQDFLELEELSSKTTLIVTHDVEEAFEMADWICLLDKGQIQQLGRPKELLFEPTNDFVRQFLADKQLQLEFLVIRLEDLFEALPDGDYSSDMQALKPRQTVFDAMGALTRLPFGISQAYIQKGGQTKVFDLSTLTQTYHQTLSKIKGA